MKRGYATLLAVFFFLNITSCRRGSLIEDNGQLRKTAAELLRTVGIPYNLREDTLSDMVKKTQKKQSNGGLMRDGAERWHAISSKLEQKRKLLLPLFKSLGMQDEIKPKGTSYKRVVIFAAWLDMFRRRLQYTCDLWNQKNIRFKKIVVLTGQRSLDKDQDSMKRLLNKDNGIIPFKDTWQFKGNNPNTETDMIKIIFDQSKIPIEWGSKIPIDYTDTPTPKGKPRTTTADTIRDWFTKNPKPMGDTLVVSSNPFAGYQFAGFLRYAPKSFKEKYQIDPAGPGARKNESMSTYCDSLGRWLWEENQKTVLQKMRSKN